MSQFTRGSFRGASRGGGDRGRGGGDRGRGQGGGRGGGFGGRGGGQGGFSREPDQKEVYGAGTFPAPNPKVSKIEDQFLKQQPSLSGSLVGLSLKDDFPKRPAYGTRGKPIVLWANYFDLTPAKDLVLYRYHVNIVPEAKGRKLKRIFELLLQEPALTGSVTNFKTLLISRNKLPDIEVEIAYRAELEDDPQPNTRPYRVHIQETGQMEVSALLTHVQSTQADPNFRPEKKLQIIDALNVLLGYYPQANPTMTTISSNKHFSFHGVKSVNFDLGGGLSALRGYFRSVRLGTGRMLVNINVSHAAFFKPGSLVDLVNSFASAYGRNPYQLEKFLKKVRVETTHLPVKKNRAGEKVARVKTISALANTEDGHSLPHKPIVPRFAAGPKEVKFWLDPNAQSSQAKPGSKKSKTSSKPQAGYISVYDFFQKTHNLTIKLPEMPVMNVGNKENPMYMPAEYCVVLPGQSSMKKLSADQTARMITFACRRPILNAKSITEDGLDVLGLLPGTNSVLAAFGVSVNNALITVPGRVLEPPAVTYGGNATESPRGGSWNMTKVKFTTGARVPPWTCLWIKRAGRQSGIQNNNLKDTIISQFREMMIKSGLTVPVAFDGPTIELDVPNSALTNDQLIDDMMKRIANNPRNVKLLLVLLPDNVSAVYNRVKYAGDILYGINTVCAVDSKAAKDRGRDQYLANIALKVNCKLFGVNQSLNMSNLGIIAEGKTMLVGIDVTHPSPGSLSSAPSVAAIVASTDKTLSQFPCELSIQKGREEMVTDLSAMFKSRLDLWKAKNNTLPENILVYRDGVSEGQYQLLKDKEIPALRAACETSYSPDMKKKGLPRISVIVVGKRHHTRFYATKVSEADRSGNPLNGTVVDRGVTSMWNWDFFLQAHTCLQGTAKPAHYYVVLDEIFGKGSLKKPHPYSNAADTLEDLTHNMCYLFARATKAISICPPAYYADLACERARCYLSGVFDPATPGGSSITGGTQTTVTTADVTIHEALRNSMFYI